MARLVRQFIGNIVKNISMDDPYVLQILDPWSLMYGEYEDDFIKVLRQRIGPKHPLYNPSFRLAVTINWRKSWKNRLNPSKFVAM